MMNEFRFPDESDLPALRRLWERGFGEAGDFPELFFDRAYHPRRCRISKVAGRLAGMLYWFDCGWSGKKAAYIFGVATDPDFRGKGIASALMKDTHRVLKEWGYDAVVLVPATEGLFSFYSRMGYRKGGTIREVVVKAGVPVSLRKIGTEEFAGLRRSYLPPNGIVQEGENLALQAGYADFYAGEGFVAVVAREPEPVCLELLGREAGSELAAALGLDSLRIRMPGDGRDFAMAVNLTSQSLPDRFYFGLAFD